MDIETGNYNFENMKNALVFTDVCSRENCKGIVENKLILSESSSSLRQTGLVSFTFSFFI